VVFNEGLGERLEQVQAANEYGFYDHGPETRTNARPQGIRDCLSGWQDGSIVSGCGLYRSLRLYPHLYRLEVN
jgi:hypothetical protein